MHLRRRAVLATIGGTLATAGCLDGGSGGETPAGNRTTQPNGTDTPTDTPTETPLGTPTDDRFADVPCPSFTETDRTICWHARPADPPVVLEPESQIYEPIQGNNTVESLRLTLRNRSDQAFGLNPYAWQLQRREDDGTWTHVAPDEHVEPWETVQPGATYEWVLATEEHPTPSEDAVVHVVEDLGSETYAFAVHGQLGGESQGEEGPAESIECVALFDVAVMVEDSWPDNATDGNESE